MDLNSLEKEKRFNASPRHHSIAHNPMKMVNHLLNEDRDHSAISPRLNSSVESNGSKERRHSLRSENLSVSGDEESHSSRRGSQNGGALKDQEDRNSTTPKRPREDDETEENDYEDNDVKRPATVSLKRTSYNDQFKY